MLFRSTHEPDISRFAKRVIMFRDGKVRWDTEVEDRATASEVLATLPVVGEEDDPEEVKA